MSDQQLPVGEDKVPERALEELLAAFAGDTPAPADPIDFDDPSIDELLGLADGGEHGHEVESGPPVEGGVVTNAVEVVPELPHASAEPVTPAVPATPVRNTIRIGGVDDLPDALYLDEEAGDRLRGTSNRSTEASLSEGRATILIGDDELVGASGGIPLATGSASMDPRLRARRIAVKRAVGRRRLKWFVVAGVVIVMVTTVLAVLGSSLFEVNNLSISGAQRISQTDLDAAVARIEHKPVLLIDTHSIEAQLERTPWVRQARVSTHFPHSASIEISERVPLATYQGPDGKFRIIDVEGHVVDVILNQPVAFMLIVGQGVNASPGASAGEAFGHAAELVQALSPAVRSRTSAVNLSGTGELSITFKTGTTVVLGAPTELLDKLTRLEAYLKLDQSQQCTRAIDVSTSEIGCSSK